jgi:regulator of protease activity HflC (stomatin/prohibitin superfamily)
MSTGLIAGIAVVVVLALILLALAVRIVQQYEKGVLFRFGRVIGEKAPGLVVIVPFVNVLRKVSFRVVTMPIQFIKEILDIQTADWGVLVTLVELKDIQLPDTMKRAMARQAEAEREKRAKIIAAEGESLAAAALGDASDIMMLHPLALQLRNLQSLIEIGVDKNTTIVFPGPLMSTIQEMGAFLTRETGAVAKMVQPSADG